jgi:nucleotidyltransferase substrate binding protein (TIGR01987 family)
MADLSAALANLERACAELESYLALPIAHARDKAGLIQGFEVTFELFWKTFQKLAPDAGLEAKSPREALMAGVGLRFIAAEESAHWAQMLVDRNLTSHTYNVHLADEIIGRLQRDYAPCFRQALLRVRASQTKRP